MTIEDPRLALPAPEEQTVSFPRTIQIVGKSKGKATTTHTITVSADGKTRTSTAKGVDKNGKPVDAVSFYEKK